MNNEIWKDIEGYEGLYKISNLGNVLSLSKKVKNGHCNKDKIINGNIDKKGYINISLRKNEKRKDYKVHRLVASAFIENKDNKQQVNHKDGNKQNNCVENLEWCNNSENLIHAYKNNLRKTKAILQYDLYGNFIKEWKNATEISKYYNVHISRIERCCQNKYGCKSSKGYIWKYKE